MAIKEVAYIVLMHTFFGSSPTMSAKRLSEKEKQQLLKDLNNGSIAPKLILFDQNLRDLSPGVTKFFENNYEPVGTGTIWRRKQADHNVGATTTFRALTSY